MSISSNIIVRTCYSRAIYNANTPIGSNIAYIRNKYGNNKPSPVQMSSHDKSVIKEFENLLLTKDGLYTIDGFSNEDVDVLIMLIATQ